MSTLATLSKILFDIPCKNFAYQGKVHLRGIRSRNHSQFCTPARKYVTKSRGVFNSKYETLVEGTFEEVTEVKRSKFIGRARSITSSEEAMSFIEELKEPEASHNCYAYKVGSEYRFNDDGEPSGTAGRPIFSALEGSGLDGVVVMVTRYFGGTKLGAGGLVRAYGSAASAVLQAAPRKTIHPQVEIQVLANFSQIGILYSTMDAVKSGLEKISEDYLDNSKILVTYMVNDDLLDSLEDTLREASNGSIEVLVKC